MSRLREMKVEIEEWPLVRPFVISRSRELTATVVVVTLNGGSTSGWGESTPYERYDETPESVMQAIEDCRDALESDPEIAASKLGLHGAAANAVDCALVDLASKRARKPAWELLKQPQPKSLLTTATLVLGEPDAMAAEAAQYPEFKLLKVKLGGDGDDVKKIEAIRKARPDARLICDANEGWSVDQLKEYAGPLARLGVEMIEQPCPAGKDEALRGLKLPLLLCADESCHVAADVADLVGKYDLVNIKLDKAGGITGSLALAEEAKRRDMGIMVGCMLATSLAMAPGVIVGQHARYVDLDGPLALTRDRPNRISYRDGQVFPASPELWG
jgi:L-alanine-DL-glutamate epimerase-like enolase superfamily enzyme